VLTNLVTNAVLHGFDHRQDGVIRILASAGDDRTVVLSLTDDGAGIAPDILPRIFDPFFTTKLGTGGSGLGLHIVYVTVTRILGGRITVDSQPGVGTHFSLTLPRRAPEREQPTATSGDARS
jgi:signal transduction histidine kinase